MQLRDLAIFKEGARLARIAAVILWGLWLVDVGAGAVLHHPSKTDAAGLIIGADFVEFYAVGQTLLEGKSTFYDRVEQRERQEKIAGMRPDGRVDFVHPPFVAIPFALLALFPYLVALGIYAVANLALLRWCMRMLAEPPATLLLVMSWFPVFAVVSYGHYTFVTMALVAGTYVLWRRGALFLAGLVFGLSAYKPNLMFGVLFLFLLDWKRAWRALAGVAVSASALALLCVVALPDASRSYVHVLTHDLAALQAGAGSLFVKEHTLHVFWNLLLPGHEIVVKVLTAVSQLSALVAYFLLWRRKPKPEIAFAFAIILAFWLTPYTIVYDISPLAIAAILLWHSLVEMRASLRDAFTVMWFAPLLSVTVLVPLQVAHLPIVVHVGELAFIIVSVVLWKRIYDSMRPRTSGASEGASPISNAL